MEEKGERGRTIFSEREKEEGIYKNTWGEISLKHVASRRRAESFPWQMVVISKRKEGKNSGKERGKEEESFLLSVWEWRKKEADNLCFERDKLR